ncbi:uncharacterized protein LOC103313796 [Tribolium castaneum]|uniref:Ribosomal protein L7Ae/L30e/S12e/Gadd45 domain-containing protein n=1 Tax=Tribolium castaneum TaxID=7070 RepID=D6WUZ8_TRICA|nr:PREDICTED: uncharacterized protein LOC103313796 [Tribolium castaneum]XP_015837814.1 PREDICTED: uncharacterized protein LOC103313796 [Tribolium castaneum]EFA08514.1 hypothetical protein TcasGA2_TC006167 [Tribolium castaneum]|eukprot:XP_008196199.1 PREDICTED: uncharacterized protein LOC103313796 [Tribolium castaneum]
MATPTISKKDLQKTLSAKKKKKAEVIKNVLAKPYQNYWPVLNSEDNFNLREALRKFLPRLKHDKVNIPYKDIKAIPREERKKFRENYPKPPLAPLLVSDSDRKSIVFGINDVSKCLEDRSAACVLVDSDVQPRLLVQHIVDQAVLYNVPVLVAVTMRPFFKVHCGVSGAAVAFKRGVKPDSGLGLIQQTICNIYENYPVPQNHIHYHRRLDTITISDSSNNSVCVVSDSEDEEPAKNYHLKRKLRKRAFVPPEPHKVVESVVYIELDTSVEASPVSKINYQPLTVKRLKGDKNRNKRKMQKFKKK